MDERDVRDADAVAPSSLPRSVTPASAASAAARRIIGRRARSSELEPRAVLDVVRRRGARVGGTERVRLWRAGSATAAARSCAWAGLSVCVFGALAARRRRRELVYAVL